jgi:hypothetical protein
LNDAVIVLVEFVFGSTDADSQCESLESLSSTGASTVISKVLPVESVTVSFVSRMEKDIS